MNLASAHRKKLGRPREDDGEDEVNISDKCIDYNNEVLCWFCAQEESEEEDDLARSDPVQLGLGKKISKEMRSLPR